MLRRAPVRASLVLGPAFIAAIAYVDPGNVATNVTAGARFGTTLIWVVVAANLAAVLVQYLSAKLGIVTGRSLPAHLGTRLPRPARVAYWLQAELVSAATDVAETIGGAVALALLFGVPLLAGAILTAVLSLIVLAVGDRHGQPVLERLVIVLLLVIGVGFTAGLVVQPPDLAEVAAGLVPGFSGVDSVLLASGIVGATVMPHVVYYHSGLTVSLRERSPLRSSVPSMLRTTRADVGLALMVAGAINLALLLVGAAGLGGADDTDSLAAIHELMGSRLGHTVAVLFAVALLVSGLASTAVGAAAGSQIMHDLIRRRIPALARRAVTVVPALVLLGLGVEPGRALVLSQVVLSIGIPAALIPLVALTARRSVMGPHANRHRTTVAAAVVTTLVVALNVALLALLAVG